ncbi:MAG: YtxH domain-containing protein [Cyanobacteria bacterium SIG30]|nr:YtxH domain-containing protein [Cyanobacteria bacterium SIG30]
MSIGKFVTGFVIGGAVGAVIGILLAPQSGEETREIIGENAKIAYKKAQDTVKDIQEKADDAVGEIKQKGDEIISKIQGMIDKNKEAEA